MEAPAAAGTSSGNPGNTKGKNAPKLQVDTFVCAPESHVAVDSHELKQAIKNRLELDDQVLFNDLCKLMEGVANFDFFDLKQRMRKNFLPFASGARNSIYLQRSSKMLPTSPVLDQKEDEFIADVYEVLRASHYTLLTKEEWDLATSENFNLNLPMEVNWDYMDNEVLAKFWNSTPERKAIRARLPDCMADRILVFHRGMGTERISGLLIDQKLDLLMDYTVFHLLDKVKQPVMDLVNKLLKKKQPESGEETTRVNRASSAAGVLPEDAAMGEYEFEGNMMIGSRHKFARSVERKTLARQCPTLLTLLKAFPTKMELQEPTFKDIVVVYRRALPPRKPPTASANAPNKSKDERMQGILSYRNINIKVFGETPMADVEMIFPEKIVGVKPFQLVNLAVTVITALVTGALVLWKAGSDLNMNIVWTAASLVLTRCFTVYNTAQTQRTMLQQQMTSALYDKMQDSQEGVVSVIMEEMSDQQLKQMLLAYMLLIIKGRALLHDDLDNACEDFLYKEFDYPIDYDLHAALPRLKRWGLVRENVQGKLEAMPMAEAMNVLDAAWASAYKVIGSESANIPTKDMITGHFSVFGAGIDKFVRNRDAAAVAAAEAASKGKGLMSKASGGFTSAGANISGGISAGFGKARGILPFSKSSSSAAAAAAEAEAAGLKPTGSRGSLGAANGSTGGLAPLYVAEDAATVPAAASSAAEVTSPYAAASTPGTGGSSKYSEGGLSPSAYASMPGESPSSSTVASPDNSYGGAPPEKKKNSLKSLFKSKKTEK